MTIKIIDYRDDTVLLEIESEHVPCVNDKIFIDTLPYIVSKSSVHYYTTGQEPFAVAIITARYIGK